MARVVVEMLIEKKDYSYVKPIELLKQKQLIKICAPMVRYSKLAFRSLVRKYGCDLAYTPMIVSNSFVASQKARDSEFTTNQYDRPLIVQFASNNGKDFADASEIVYPNCDGVDINCGCPQRWALAEGYGVSLMNEPEILKDMICQVKNRISDNEFTISLKTRIHEDIKQTVEFCRRAEKAGASWISVHARTEKQRCEPISVDGLKTIKESVKIPIIGNGSIFDLYDAQDLKEMTGVNGVMSARGLLQNPGLFMGHACTTVQCIQDWLDLSLSLGTSFTIFHQHLAFMLEKSLPKIERRFFNSLTSTSAVLDFLSEFFCYQFVSCNSI